MLRAVIFDFDGVIVDSEPVHAAALTEALRPEGLTLSIAEYNTQYLGLCDREIVEGVFLAAGRSPRQEDLARVMAAKRVSMERSIDAGACRPYVASLALMRSAAALFPVAVCSGALRHEIDAVMAWLNLAGLPAAITSAEETPRSKPDPAPYVLTLEKLGLGAGGCVAIEDTARGIASAKAAGLVAVGVCHTMPARELILAGADFVAESSEELSLGALEALALERGV
jgi:beta-phosphoglucomutase